MKKALYLVVLMIGLIFVFTQIQSSEVKAEQTLIDVFDYAKVDSITTGDPLESVKSLLFTYTDVSLDDGYYKLVFYDIYYNPDTIGYTTSSNTMSTYWYYRQYSVNLEEHDFMMGYDYDEQTDKMTFYVYVQSGKIIVYLESDNNFYNNEDIAYSFGQSELYLELSDLDPIFTWSQGTLQIPYYDLMTINEIKALISVTDSEDGDLTSSIVLYDDNYSHWTPDGTLPDDLYLIFSVTDSSNNVAYLQIDIEIIDDLPIQVYIDDVNVTPQDEENPYIEHTIYIPYYHWKYDDWINYNASFISEVLDHIKIKDYSQYEYLTLSEQIYDESLVDYFIYDFDYTFPSINNLLNDLPNSITDMTLQLVSLTSGKTTYLYIDIVIVLNGQQNASLPEYDIPYYADKLVYQDILDEINSIIDSGSPQVHLNITQLNAFDVYEQWTPDGTLPSFEIEVEIEDQWGFLGYSYFIINIIDDRIPEVSYSQELIDEIGFTYSVTVNQNKFISILINLKYEQLTINNLQKLIYSIWYYDYSINGPLYYDETQFTNHIEVVESHIDLLYLLNQIEEEEYTQFEIYLDSDVIIDLYGNPFEITLNINLIDEHSPVVTSPSQIVKSKTATLTETEIRSQLVITDNVDDLEDLTITKVSDTYTGKENKIGRYQIQYRIEDTSGNFVLHTVVIWVLNIQPPVWVLDNRIVTVTINEPITSQQLLDNLSALGLLSQQGQTFTIEVLSDNFTGNENISGQYMMQLLVNYSDGSSEVIELSINVTDFEVQPTINTDTLSIVLSVGGVGLLVFGIYRLVKPKKRNTFLNR